MNHIICNERVSEEGEINLLTFPCSGGTASSFIGWKERLSKRINLYPIQLPMREKRARDRMPENIRLLAQSLAEDCLELVKDKKFAFLGDCSGSLIAYEAAVYLNEKYGIVPETVFVLSSPSPDIPNPMMFEGTLISQLDDEKFIAFLKANMNFPNEFYANKFAINYYKKIVRTDFQLVEEYDYAMREKLKCDLSVFFGTADSYMSEEQSAGWKNFTNGTFRHHVLDGGHTIFETHAQTICGEVESTLLKA